ncbi:MAG TPA: RDD family protein [Chloroflexota bacterium]|jgi:uncharacterized RDD family membrane protein YckC|nr:RDD family protein [Chloroflexota bacterium]
MTDAVLPDTGASVTSKTCPFTAADVRHLPRRAGAVLVDDVLIVIAIAIFLAITVRTTSPQYVNTPAGRILEGRATTTLNLGVTVDLLFLLGTLAYFTLFEWALGATVGKLLFGLRVVDFYGGRPQLGQAFWRNVGRIADSLPVLYLVGFVVAIRNSPRQRLGDKLARTLVVHKSSLSRATTT